MRGGRYQEPLVQAAVAKTKSSSGGWEGVMRGRRYQEPLVQSSVAKIKNSTVKIRNQNYSSLVSVVTFVLLFKVSTINRNPRKNILILTLDNYSHSYLTESNWKFS